MTDSRSYAWYFAMSEDAENYTRASSREEAIAEGLEVAREDGHDCFYICQAAHFSLSDDIFDGLRVCEQFEEFNEMAWGEDGPNASVSTEAIADLQQTLTAAFATWRAKYEPWAAYMLEDFRNGEKIEALRP